MEILPGLADVGVRKLFTGPESFTPDNGFLMGEAPELDGFFVAAGFNSLGILTGGGAGSITANRIVDGVPPVDVTGDRRRPPPALADEPAVSHRAQRRVARPAPLDGLVADSHPTTARNVRRSPLHDRLVAAGARFAESSGWENTSYFAPLDADIEFRPTYGRPDWFDHHAAEHHSVRNAVALFDMSAMSKFLVQGPDAESVLNRLSGNDVAVPVGRCVYTQWMNERGGVMADVPITALADHRFQVVVAEGFHRRVESMLGARRRRTAHAVGHRRHIRPGTVERAGSERGGVAGGVDDIRPLEPGVPGPHGAGDRRAPLDGARCADELRRRARMGAVRADRVRASVCTTGSSMSALRTVSLMPAWRRWRAPAPRPAGSTTASTWRTPTRRSKPGLKFAIHFDKPDGFVGRDALLAQYEQRPYRNRLVQFLFIDPEPLLHGEEPILLHGDPVGYMRSGAYGHTLGGAMGSATLWTPTG